MDRAAQLLTGFRILIFLRIEAVLKSLNPFVEKSLGPVLWGKVFRQFIEIRYSLSGTIYMMLKCGFKSFLQPLTSLSYATSQNAL